MRQLGGGQEQPPVEGGQIGEGQETGDDARMIGGRIVLLREFRQRAPDGDAQRTKDHNEEKTVRDAADELPRLL